MNKYGFLRRSTRVGLRRRSQTLACARSLTLSGESALLCVRGVQSSPVVSLSFSFFWEKPFSEWVKKIAISTEENNSPANAAAVPRFTISRLSLRSSTPAFGLLWQQPFEVWTQTSGHSICFCGWGGGDFIRVCLRTTGCAVSEPAGFGKLIGGGGGGGCCWFAIAAIHGWFFWA